MKKSIDTHYSIDKSLYQHQSLKRSRQLSLFTIVPEPEDPQDLPPFALQIEVIPNQDRLKPEWGCRLIHYESDLKLGGQFTWDEAQEILKTSRYWDFTVDKDRIPRCRNQLLSLLERVCSNDRNSSKKQEVAA